MIDTDPSRIGTMIPMERKIASAVFQRNLYSVSAHAAMAPKSSVKKIVPTVTVMEFM